MPLQNAEKLDLVNIGLMLIACAVAFYIPFELFLFSYAILGPLHYLTEISWLHDRNYYTKERYDAVILLVIGALLTVSFFSNRLELDFPFDANLAYIAFLGSLIFVTVKNKFYRIAGIVLLVLTSKLASNFAIFFTVFLPTLIHVYVFTGFFMLYGALKSKSRFGILAVLVLVLCPVLLYSIYPNMAFHLPGEFSKNAMAPFRVMNINYLVHLRGHELQPTMAAWDNVIFNSQAGILAMRFVAFAYTYHYLNWFSKTSIIQWHKVPRLRFIAVLIIWAASIALYLYKYLVGLQWLFFLSMLHVLLELPLNFTSIIGIGKYMQGKVTKPVATKA